MPDTSIGEGAGVTWLPDYVYAGGRFESGLAVACDSRGRITHFTREAATGDSPPVVRLKDRAMLPGLVNAHSHAFQRVIRGRTERRTGAHDSFWTWREMMYSAATRLDAEGMADASRMAFLEMALAGITSVGEFHYIHRGTDGAPYADANLLAKAVVGAARDVGLRIALLRVAYARSGFQVPPDERQKRFIEPDVDVYLRHVEDLRQHLAAQPGDEYAWVGLAPHSVRAAPLEYIQEANRFAVENRLPVHMHVAEQPAEVAACLRETGRTPLMLLGSEGVLGPHFTGVHVIHVEEPHSDVHYLKESGAIVCACPTTERNLGDGIIPADLFFKEGIRVALGTDSHAQIDMMEDARELEYHLRLRKLERSVLAPQGDDSASALARRLFECATISGARSVNAPAGELAPGRPADFFTVDLNDPSIAGATPDDLLACVVFGSARTAIKEVFVGGKQIVAEGRHPAQEETVRRFAALQRKLWN
jgi:formimidoylglutamate deiminase